ncbi:hypothetical protein SPF06_06925 [Sinomonas sp. JGH33]|uniref:Uncharacterized protein n=1 Tax=Sinomonas terricola TaxID=3110330 RepID=A0ABU5T480_9MICC|nr:hypothetical protein [Sinomonas sp. JGH33]MEA5454450.1 hypothetical protein [Sinomonas sp. JGH33]
MSPRRRSGAVAAFLAVAVVGCSPARPAGAPTSAPSPSPTAPIAVVVDQFRDGYASETVVLQLDDVAAGAITVTRAELVDPRFEDGAAWAGSTDLSPGYPISLPAATTAPRCGTPDDGDPSVRVTFADGGAIVVPATDPHRVLPRIHSEKCFAIRVADSARLRLDDGLAETGPARTATLELFADRPTGHGPSENLELVSVSNTTLLDEDPAAPWPQNVHIAAGGAPIPLTVRPARCDPHAVAEDKVGTLIPLTIRVGDTTGVVKVPASNALKTKIYAFVARACGWTAG